MGGRQEPNRQGRSIIGALLTIVILVAVTAVRVPAQSPPPSGSCFLLYEVGVGETRREPQSSCGVRVTPASTFKIPHALAALDAGVLAGPDVIFKYDGRPVDLDAWRRDHTLATAMRYSVVWYFQRIAERLGPAREREYLERLNYGNHDPSSGLTTFWIGGSLRISPEEEEQFLLRLYDDRLPVSGKAMKTVRDMLEQPSGVVTNATGEHLFDSPWPRGTVLSAKTGSATDLTGGNVRWLVGHVQRESRSWVFVSNVVGAGGTPAEAAIDLAARALRESGVLP
jgi:beta-lactamase class D